MLRPLLCLCALIAQTGAQWFYQQTFTESSVVNISSCPITYYGQQYEQLYVNITSGNVTACFNGFFSPETGGDCVVERSRGAESFYFAIYSNHYYYNDYDYCYFYIYFNNMYLVHLISGTQRYLYSYNYISDPTEFELQVGGTTVDTVNVTAYTVYYFSFSGCRHSGQMYRPGAVISSDPETCFSLTCNETAVLNTSSCGPLERCQGNNM
ncbi:uncharacterized protein LOC102314270 [Haplochromis burtoni]|uniref:uncharacterized protein LOC102314270 n=1 Tax=Haplochromis burtoni TaxID=8153 RepID=UPI001C2D3BB1|nr:uncharacterized protein LOC102314270 [Haplochromis burtoni]XP_042073658.1 uncharacterized protein LOC102314270 [Haplochromis burtoni]XP_042073659.1 uncharacterized protein LOC102314270 [Haplochromis burtoni]XP_042073660.1 uncharacterized protein LOC102314270 [Haplochromis burtoni]XP_042073661.1 uncharacterized protein LOC102314270 [Haplochromis burtoni]